MAEGTKAITPQIVAVFSAWLALNLALNYYNKWCLSQTNFRFPFLLTIGNKVTGFFVAVVLMCANKGLPQPQELVEHFKRPLVHAQGVATALNIGLNNWSLVFISLTLNQVLKSTVPLPTALLSVMFESKSFSWQLYGSMVVLVIGCILAAWGGAGDELEDGNWVGILICLGSVLATAAWTVSSAVLMQMGEKPLDAVSLIFVSGPTCIATLLCFFFALELPRLINFASDPEHPVPSVGEMMLYLGAAAALASVYDIVHNQFVKLTSSVNMAFMGNTKLVLLIGLSMATMERTPTPLRIAGVSVAVLGVVWYSIFKLGWLEPPPPPKDDTASPEGDKTAPLAEQIEKGEKPTEASSLLGSLGIKR